MAIDPICGMAVDETTAKWTTTVDGKTFYFCSPGCKARFEAETPSTQHSALSTFTCPMHPEIVRDSPGFCPICGMALEPRVATLEAPPNEELLHMQRRFVVSAVLSAPVLALGMMMRAPWAQFALATPVVLWGGWPFFVRGWASVVARRLDLVTRGQALEPRARERTGDAIRALLGLAPKNARVVFDDGTESDIAVDEIRAGMKLRVRPGERVPVDGVVVDGHASLDE